MYQPQMHFKTSANMSLLPTVTMPMHQISKSVKCKLKSQDVSVMCKSFWFQELCECLHAMVTWR